MITGSTKIFGVIADPIAHVRAPMVFNPAFEELGIDGILVPLHIKPDNLADSLRALAAMPNMGGVCVTIPHKLAAAKLCDGLGLAATITGAVNALRFEDGRIFGDNFDGQGFVAGFEGEGHNLTGKNILIIGAGGAARAIAAALAQCPIEKLTIANRTLDKAEQITGIIKQHFRHCSCEAMDSQHIQSIITEQHVIINTTSLGLDKGDALPCGLDTASPDAIIADIIMTPPITPWMQIALKKGLKIHAGKYMLDYQRNLIGRFIGAFPPE